MTRSATASARTDANGHVTRFAYDQLGRRSNRTLPLGQSEQYAYDAAGNLTARTDFNNHTTIFNYDTMNRLRSKDRGRVLLYWRVRQRRLRGNAGTYTYTATGRRLSMADASGPTSYTYDNRDRLLTKAISVWHTDLYL